MIGIILKINMKVNHKNDVQKYEQHLCISLKFKQNKYIMHKISHFIVASYFLFGMHEILFLDQRYETYEFSNILSFNFNDS